MVAPLLATYSAVLVVMSFAAWLFAFETRKTFRGGIFWNAWRIIASSVIFLMANQVVAVYEAINGDTFAADAVAQSFAALATLLLLLGFYLFYKAWNPKAMASSG
jgi:hypothetical protein